MPKLMLAASLAVLVLATPAMAQVGLTPTPDASSSADPSMDLSAAPDTSSEPMDDLPDSPPMDMSLPDDAPPMPSPAALRLFVETCTAVSSGDPAGRDKALASGWAAYDNEDTGPYKSLFTASQEVPGYGTVELWSSVETYPTQKLGYCRVDLSDYDSRLDFKDMALAGLTGTEAVGEAGNVHGVWESADHKMLVIVDRTDGETAIEFNILIGPAPAQN